MTLKKYLDGLLHLFFPSICPGCKERIPANNSNLCISCLTTLPLTDFHLYPENDFTRRFWGRVNVVHGTAMMYFIKKGITQNIIHSLKYEHGQPLGYELGSIFGRLLKQSPFYKEIDVIVPVPLHPSKEKKRGYNQSFIFAKGIGEQLGIAVVSNLLTRVIDTETQTNKSRNDRVVNVRGAFAISETSAISQKHILLVDDVLTTGATLEACGLELLKETNVRVSMATIAIGDV